ncbi:hypothetical protein CAPTEDRAFT_198445 [Capitella teleta]|uniref:Transmembrane protein 192 n=1 Tax=Capitella teleta TaxID=283909 RepID=R7TW32_CAPTE|nr:hypothetical protein CAPTEDRAFT_198445 [Capitella teleta]|eukprot:ELT97924.1 hypothetical protein CAPTEDRAFT_198445 [Capitella teleta]
MANTEGIQNDYEASFRSHATSDEELLSNQIHPNTDHQSTTHSKCLFSIAILICALCFDAVFILILFLLPSLSYNGSDVKGRSPVLIIQSCHCAMWCIFFLFEYLLDRQFEQIRMAGYLAFYRKTLALRSLPYHVISAGSVLLLLLVTLLDVFCDKTETVPCSSLKLLRVNFLQIAIVIEMVIILTFQVMLIILTLRFDRQRLAPDIDRDETVPSNLFPNANAEDIVGYRDGSALDDLLERQADYIEYLRSHNTQLATKVLYLNAQLENHVHSGKMK